MTELIVILVLGLCGAAFYLGQRQGRASQRQLIDAQTKAASQAAAVRKDKLAARALLQTWFESGARPPGDDYRKLIGEIELETEPRQIRFLLHSIYEQNTKDVVVDDIDLSESRPDKPNLTVDIFEKFDEELAWEIQFLDQEIRRISLGMQRGALTRRFFAWLELGKIDPHLRPDVLNRIEIASSLRELECIETRCRELLARAETYDPDIDIFHGQFPPPELPSLGDLSPTSLSEFQRTKNVSLDGYLLLRANGAASRTDFARLLQDLDECEDGAALRLIERNFHEGLYEMSSTEWARSRY